MINLKIKYSPLLNQLIFTGLATVPCNGCDKFLSRKDIMAVRNNGLTEAHSLKFAIGQTET